MGQMTAALAHELNQPLTAVGNYLRAGQRLLEEEASPDVERLKTGLEAAMMQLQRAGLIIDRLHGFVARGEVDMQVGAAVAGLVEEAAALAAGEIREHGVSLSIELDPVARLVLVDRVQVQQVLVNLIRNAVAAMQDSPRRGLSIASRRSDGLVELSVADTGDGPSEEVRDHLFEPFVTTRPDGTGLGLAICQSIVEAHDGSAFLGKPCLAAEPSFALPSLGWRNLADAEEPQMTDGGDAVVLVIDDDDGVRESLVFLFEVDNLPARGFAGIEEFLAALPLPAAECIVTDMHMPCRGGLELLRLLPGRGVTLPVIVITGQGEVETAARVLSAGAFELYRETLSGLRDPAGGSARPWRPGRPDPNRDAQARATRDTIARLSATCRNVLDRLVSGDPNRTRSPTSSASSSKPSNSCAAASWTSSAASSLPELIRMVTAARRYGRSDRRQPVELRRGVVEQRGLMFGRGAGGDPLERVPQHRVAAHRLVDGKIALEHAAVGAERLDARHPWRPVLRHAFGRGGSLSL